MQVEALPVGVFQSNCYIASCEKTGEAVIFDPGADGERIVEIVDAHGLNVTMIVCTHAHIDHVAALPEVLARFPVPVLMNNKDLPLYKMVPQQAEMFGLPPVSTVPVDRHIGEGDAITIGEAVGVVRETPGHSPGGISIVFGDEQPPCVFVGDVVFMGSIGRTDLMGADHAGMMRTLRDVVLSWPDEMMIYSGHGPATTVGRERAHNPFLLELR